MSIKIDRKSNRIRVVVRIRPVNDKDRKEIASTRGLTGEICVFLKPDGQTIELHRDMYDIRQFRFDRVFGSIASQGDVYEYACKDIINDFTSGYDGCVLAYGQTGTGKTYSMFGDSVSQLQNNTNANSNNKNINNTFPLRYGIMQRSMNDIFKYIEQCREEGKNARIYISFYQIYLEKITDLLDSRSDKLSRGSVDMKAKDYYLPIREDPIKGTYIEGLSVIPVQSVEEFMSLVNKAVWNRVTQVSRMNDSSSRSHAVMTLTLEQDDNIFPEGDEIVYNSSPQNDNNNVRSVYEGIPVSRSPIDLNQSTPLVIERRKKQIRNTLTFGDLAGSERIRLEGGSGLRLREGKIINQSICSLGMCIRALADRQSDSSGARTAKSSHHIPYRNSNLTRLLANSIGGKSKTCIISTIGPCLHSFEETHTTLLFASRAAAIKIVAQRAKPVLASGSDLSEQMREWKWPVSKPLPKMKVTSLLSSDFDSTDDDDESSTAVLNNVDDVCVGLNISTKKSTKDNSVRSFRIHKVKSGDSDDETLKKSRAKQKADLSRLLVSTYVASDSPPQQSPASSPTVSMTANSQVNHKLNGNVINQEDNYLSNVHISHNSYLCSVMDAGSTTSPVSGPVVSTYPRSDLMNGEEVEREIDGNGNQYMNDFLEPSDDDILLNIDVSEGEYNPGRVLSYKSWIDDRSISNESDKSSNDDMINGVNHTSRLMENIGFPIEVSPSSASDTINHSTDSPDTSHNSSNNSNDISDGDGNDDSMHGGKVELSHHFNEENINEENINNKESSHIVSICKVLVKNVPPPMQVPVAIANDSNSEVLIHISNNPVQNKKIPPPPPPHMITTSITNNTVSLECKQCIILQEEINNLKQQLQLLIENTKSSNQNIISP